MDDDAATEKPNANGVFVESVGDSDDHVSNKSYKTERAHEVTLYAIFNRLISAVVFRNSGADYDSAPLPTRIKASLSENVPLLPDASKNTAHHVLSWTRRGSPLRALLVVSVGTIALLALTGLLVFMLFFVAATVNAIIISLLMSLAAAGGFLALFFACVTAIYIGALSTAVFVISTATISAMIAVLIVSGWIGFFWTVWMATKKSVSLTKHSLTAAGSALSAYSPTRHARNQCEPNKLSE